MKVELERTGGPHNEHRLTVRRDPGSVERMDPKARKKLEDLLYSLTHRDYKGRNGDGTRSVLHNESGVTYGTESWPLSTFTDAQLVSALRGFGAKLRERLASRVQKVLDKVAPGLQASEVEWEALRVSVRECILEGRSEEDLRNTTRVLVETLLECRDA